MLVNGQEYELVVGLEVHAQLLLQTKLFCGDAASFGAEPNTQVSPVTLGHPGSLPRLNKRAVECAVRLGLACNCEIARENYFARKNYFYPDLPKGYQISQHTSPICTGGWVWIESPFGRQKIILNRIHLEEDAGKSLHDQDPDYTCIDYNRAGVALVEIVTEPCIHSVEDAYAYLTELRKLVRYLDVCDGNMEEGSMRCDANISIRKKGETKLGTKVEVKNLNSIRNVKKAIEIEAIRLTEIISTGGTVIQETRSFDASNSTTFALRTKEEANDYRYFPDPDLTPFLVSEKLLQEIKNSLPELPEQRIKRYQHQLQLPAYDAKLLSEDKDFAYYFDDLITKTSHYKAAANWMLGPVSSYLNDKQLTITRFPVSTDTLAEIIELVATGKLNFSSASGSLLPQMIKNPHTRPLDIAEKLNLVQDSDLSNITGWVDEVLNKMPDKVLEFRNGKKGLIGLFVGEVKKISKGKADPKVATDILLKKLQP